MAEFESKSERIVCEYNTNLQLKPKQYEIFNFIWDGEQNIVAALPTGYGKSIVYHLYGHLIHARNGTAQGITVVAPLNIIQRDQLTFGR